jgi:hypothetical protein
LEEFNKDFDEDELDIEEEGSPDSGNEEVSSDNDE